MGNVSRVAILKATPALVLSAAVLFSAAAHAQSVAAQPSQPNELESTGLFGATYESVRDLRNAVSKTRATLVQSEKSFQEAKASHKVLAEARKDASAALAPLTTAKESFQAAKVNYEKRASEDGFVPFEKLTREAFIAQPEFQDALTKGMDTPAVKSYVALKSGAEIMKSLDEASELFQRNVKTFDAMIDGAQKMMDARTAEARSLQPQLEEQEFKAGVLNIVYPRGVESKANDNGGWASGDLANAGGVESTAFGTGAEAKGDHASAVGHRARANGVGASAFGKNADASGYGSSASGYQASATGVGATATGAYALASGAGATAVGAGSMAVNGGTAIGAYSSAVAGATAIGQGAVADANGAVAIGDAVVNKEANTVAFANGDDAKRLTHVAAGQNDTDAVNVKQIRESAQGVKSALRVEMDASSQRAISQSNGYTDQKVGEIRKEMAALDKSFRRGIASSAALMMSTPYAPGKVAATAGTALYRGTPAIAAGASYWNQGGTWNINGGIATAGSNSTIIRLGGSMLF